MNSSIWRNKYVRIYFGEERFYISVARYSGWPTDCWISHIYNFQQGYWETKQVSCGDHSGVAGWTKWEYFDLTTCPSIPGIKAADIMIKLDLASNQWVFLAPSHTGDIKIGPCFSDAGGPYTFDVHQADYEWHAHTPNNN